MAEQHNEVSVKYFCSKCEKFYESPTKENNCPDCGYRITLLKKNSNPKRTERIFGIGILIGLIFLFGYGFFFRSSYSSFPSYSDDNSSEPDYSHKAWVCAQLKVEKMLKSPSSARFEFGGATYSTKSLGNNKYKVDSYVDAQNSFGASIRQQFTCNITYKPKSESCKTTCSFH